LLWVGTGEANNRQSLSWGSGVWKTTDGGRTFKQMGLAKSYHINRIVLHPADNNIVLVAAQGSLWGAGGDRGVYKTTDGGTTWKQVLKVDDDTGANDLVMSASDPNILYASTYQRRRSQCCMNGGGPGSAIWKSIDGGETWTKLTNGLPAGPLGRIALDVYRKSANLVYAQIEAQGAAGGGGRGGGGGAGAGGGAAAVGRLPHAAAPRQALAIVRFAGANPEQVRVFLRDREVADRDQPLRLELRRERRAGVGRLPDAAVRGADVEDRRVGFVHGEVGEPAGHARGPDRAEVEPIERIGGAGGGRGALAGDRRTKGDGQRQRQRGTGSNHSQKPEHGASRRQWSHDYR
jgi:hypothetical protein